MSSVNLHSHNIYCERMPFPGSPFCWSTVQGLLRNACRSAGRCPRVHPIISSCNVCSCFYLTPPPYPLPPTYSAIVSFRMPSEKGSVGGTAVPVFQSPNFFWKFSKHIEKHIDPCYDKNTLKNLFFIMEKGCIYRFPHIITGFWKKSGSGRLPESIR